MPRRTVPSEIYKQATQSVWVVIIHNTSTHKETYRAAVFIVEAAMTKPIIPNVKGMAMCQNRSPVLSECLSHNLIREADTDHR